MSTSSISSASSGYQPNSLQSTLRQNFQTLSQAIQSGNLSAAQQAYAARSQNAPAQANGSAANPFQQALAGIGSALQSGDIASAQTALQGLQQNMKAHHGHHHRGSADAGGSSAQASTAISTLLSAASPPVDISA